MPDSDAWLIPGSRREAALERIYAAGSDVLRERGPKKFSLEEVARRAGCSRATVYRFVGNKRSLVDTLVGLAATTVVEQVRTQTRGMQGNNWSSSRSLPESKRFAATAPWLSSSSHPRLSTTPTSPTPKC